MNFIDTTGFSIPQPPNPTVPNKSVLFVDDEPDISTTLSYIIAERVGCPTYGAQNMEDALKICQTHHPEIVVLDLSIPVRHGQHASIENGIRVMEELRKAGSDYHPYIFVASGHGDSRFRHIIMQHYDVQEYFIKGEPSFTGDQRGCFTHHGGVRGLSSDSLVAKIREYLSKTG